MTKKHHRLFAKSTAEPERIERIVEGYEAVMSRIEALREFGTQRTMGEIDGEVGREAGYLNTAFVFREIMPVDRLLMASDSLGCDVSDLFVTLETSEPRPAVGFLPAIGRRRDNEPNRPSVLNDLQTWASRVAIAEDGDGDGDGDGFPITGGEALIEVSKTNTKAALRMAEGLFGALVDASPDALAVDSCDQLARLLTIYGELLRRSGEHVGAAEALDLAFILEGLTQRRETIAFTYRMGTYLLNDWGRLDDGLMFIHRSERLCVSVGDSEGLGRTLYIQAICLGLRGAFRRSVDRFEASRSMLGPSRIDPMFDASIEHSIAWTWVQEGRIERARQSARRLHTILEKAEQPPDTLFFGYHHTLMAEIASLTGARAEATPRYEAASKILADQPGDVLEQLFVGLLHVRHLLRYSQIADAERTFQALVPLASDMAGNVWAEAFVLKLLRDRATLTLDTLERAIRALQHARLQR